MRVIRMEECGEPFRAPLGEEIYEMIGRPQHLGGTVSHSLVHVVIPPGKCSPSHIHRVSEETYYILSGEAQMTIDGNSWRATPGMAIAIMPGEVHQIVNDTDGQLDFLTISAPAWVPEDTYEVQMPALES
ncbi:hypothetical protein GCM10009811_08040 [Nostocoides veronense]|uniref:Cupin type-2 domain-containing protein n=2 Tax=Nostocoides veronense TaxID=330836 RepID=A0ABN2LF07_9MICO